MGAGSTRVVELAVASYVYHDSARQFISFGLGGLSEKAGLTRGEFAIVSFVLSCVLTGLVSIYILKDVLDKDFGKFRVCIIPNDSLGSK